MNYSELKMNWRDLKSKTGMFLAGAYVLFVIWVFVAIVTMQSPNSTAGLALLFVTAPGSFLPLIIFGFLFYEVLGISELNTDFFGYVCVIFGAAVNALILYFLGYSLAIMFASLRGSIRNVLSKRSNK